MIQPKFTSKGLKAIIFDMDGLLVDSEPCWHIAEKIVFGEVEIELTTELCLETTGKPVRDVIQFWYEKQPWPNPNFDRMEEKLFTEATNAIKRAAPLMPYVRETIKWAKKKGLKIGLASASPIDMIEMVLGKFNLTHFFDFYHSAELEEFNKPHPAVYLTVAKNLQVSIEDCLILEDSGNGVKGAIASGARVIAVPGKFEFEHEKFDLADAKIRSLKELPLLF